MRKILIVIDMQNDFIDGSLGTKEAVEIIPKAVNKIKQFKAEDIIVTLDTHDNNYLNTVEGIHLPVLHCQKYSHGWSLNESIFESVNCFEHGFKVVEKCGFAAKELVDIFEEYSLWDEIEIEIIGLCTDICVVSNAILLKTFFPNVAITVDASCCVGATPETHKAALETMKMCQINVIGE